MTTTKSRLSSTVAELQQETAKLQQLYSEVEMMAESPPSFVTTYKPWLWLLLGAALGAGVVTITQWIIS